MCPLNYGWLSNGLLINWTIWKRLRWNLNVVRTIPFCTGFSGSICFNHWDEETRTGSLLYKARSLRHRYGKNNKTSQTDDKTHEAFIVKDTTTQFVISVLFFSMQFYTKTSIYFTSHMLYWHKCFNFTLMKACGDIYMSDPVPHELV